MESTGGLRRAAPLACARRGRARPANRGRGRGDDAETARRPDRGGVREGVTERGRVHPTRAPRGVQHRPASVQGRRDSFDSPDQVVGYRITWRSRDGWTERFNATDLGADMRLKELRNGWTHDAPIQSLAVQEWRASMENRPPFLADGLERRPANLSTHDMERLIDEAFHVAVNVRRGEGGPRKHTTRRCARDCACSTGCPNGTGSGMDSRPRS